MNCTDKRCPIDYKNHTCFRNTQGQLHKDDGAALIWPGGTQEWYLNGMRHREDGPAIIYPDGTQYWYLNNKRTS